MGIGRLVFNMTGVMSNKGIIKNANKIGEHIAETVAKNEKIEVNEIQEILTSTIGKKAARKIRLTKTKDEFVQAMKQGLEVEESIANETYKKCLGGTIPYNGGAIVNLKPELYTPNKAVNTISHELEHALHQTFGIDNLIDNLKQKTKWGRKKLEKTQKQMNLKLINNATLAGTQEDLILLARIPLGGAFGLSKNNGGIFGLLKQVGYNSKQELNQGIRDTLYKEGILDCQNTTYNTLKIKVLKKLLKGEAMAYKVGGRAESIYYNKIGENVENLATNSTLYADFHKQVLKVIKKESRRNKLNRIKEFFGIKVDRTKEIALGIEKFDINTEEIPLEHIINMVNDNSIKYLQLKPELRKQVEEFLAKANI